MTKFTIIANTNRPRESFAYNVESATSDRDVLLGLCIQEALSDGLDANRAFFSVYWPYFCWSSNSTSRFLLNTESSIRSLLGLMTNPLKSKRLW